MTTPRVEHGNPHLSYGQQHSRRRSSRRFEDTEQAEQFAADGNDTVADRYITVSFHADIDERDRSSHLEQLRSTHRSD